MGVKAILHPVKNGKVACEGIVIESPPWWKRLLRMLWEGTKIVGFAGFWFIMGRIV